jgi:guanosine-3',5'-bis(diphosphate) 3'-pyrophosphohydrolase
MMESVLEQVKKFADEAHGTQMRRYSPDRYIVHPERVMNTVKNYSNNVSVLAAALLHDVLEDTATTREEILSFLKTVMSSHEAQRTLLIVEELTDVYTKNEYPQWNRRKRRTKEAERLGKASKEAQTIKYADIIDNCPEIVREDPDFAQRYVSECIELARAMKNGNAELRELALEKLAEAKKAVDRSSSKNKG